MDLLQNFGAIQNCLARLVTQSPQFSHSVPIRISLHWLPVQSRIIFKLCFIAYQALSSGEPSYQLSILSLAPKPRGFHSTGFHLLSVPRVKTYTGTLFFSCCPYSLEFTL